MTSATRASDLIGDRVKDLRGRRGLTREQLSERCAAIGATTVSPSVLVNIETGRPDKATGIRRRDVTVDELLVLAAALEVPPVLLLLPAGPKALAVTEQVGMHAPDLLAWVSGEDGPPLAVRRDQGTVQRWFEASAPLRLMREFRRASALPVALAQPVVTISDEERREKITKAVDDLIGLVHRMIESGVIPPPIPRELVEQMIRRGLRYVDQISIAPDGARSDDLVSLLVEAGLIAPAEG